MSGMSEEKPPSRHPSCTSCLGSGEIATDYGAVDCPDCGGAGFLPTRHVLVDWRARDIERSLPKRERQDAADLAWALAEMQRARAALIEVVALAHDIEGNEPIGSRIRLVANRALGLYEPGPSETAAPTSGATSSASGS